ncbi:MAG: isoprenoid biosynthesis glyoxalase ElbB [Thermodesulfobacteriota bacterium]
MKNVGVLLSGCGVYDGSEIHETVITLLAIERNGAETVCMAPDIPQHHVVNHLTGQTEEETRNVLVESARIARGEITDIKHIRTVDIDALVIPGGFGAAKNFSDFAIKGKDAEVHAEVRRLITEMADAKKPIGAMCISPAVLAKVIEDRHPRVTIGNDLGTAEAIEAMGGTHTVCETLAIHVDNENMLVTTPAYMIGPSISHVAEGIEKMVKKVLEMA